MSGSEGFKDMSYEDYLKKAQKAQASFPEPEVQPEVQVEPEVKQEEKIGEEKVNDFKITEKPDGTRDIKAGKVVGKSIKFVNGRMIVDGREI